MASGSAHVRKVAGSNASIEEKVTAIEDNLRLIDDRVTSVDNQLRANIADLRTTIASERTAREEMERSIRAQLEDLSAGGLDFEAVGVAWVVIGNALTTFPCEIAKLLGMATQC